MLGNQHPYFHFNSQTEKSSLRLLLQERVGLCRGQGNPSASGDSIRQKSQTQRALRASSPLRTISPLSPGLALFLCVLSQIDSGGVCRENKSENWPSRSAAPRLAVSAPSLDYF